MEVQKPSKNNFLKLTFLILSFFLLALNLGSCGGGGGDGSTTALFSISGTVTTGSSGLSGVTMALTGTSSASTTTDSNGTYQFTGLAAGSYTITPSKTGCAFSPSSRSVSISTANITGQDFTATVTWAMTFGDLYDDMAHSAQQTSDGGYIVAGETSSLGAGSADFWVLKLTVYGGIDWQKTYGGSSDDVAKSIRQTSDGGYIVAGQSSSLGNILGDIWILKIKSNGDIDWQKAFGGTGSSTANAVHQTSDGDYIVAGETSSTGAGDADIWLLKLDPSGNLRSGWPKTYGGADRDAANSIQQTSDGGYIVAGETSSSGAGFKDAWVLKLDSNGTVVWQNTFGGANYDIAYSIQQTTDGGYIVAGETSSSGAGSADVWILKLDGSGNLQSGWPKTYGGIYRDAARSIQQTSDGGFIVAGETYSYGAGDADAWILKLDASGTVVWQTTFGGTSYDIAYSIQQTTDGGYIVAGETSSSGAGSADFWVLKLNSDGTISQ